MPNDDEIELPEGIKSLAAEYRSKQAPAYFSERVMANAREAGRSKPFLRYASAGMAVAAILVAVVMTPVLQRHSGEPVLMATNPPEPANMAAASLPELPVPGPSKAPGDLSEPLEQTAVLAMADDWLESGSEADVPVLADFDDAVSLIDIPDPLG